MVNVWLTLIMEYMQYGTLHCNSSASQSYVNSCLKVNQSFEHVLGTTITITISFVVAKLVQCVV